MKRPMKEGTPRDNREDKTLVKKAGMSMKQWESSKADEVHDRGMKRGGPVRKGKC